ncbi:MAG: hypothetical protein DWQ07_07135 [Chloroflexi bacterium]|nr:MAG: hypothetical protein DWQ07_07135 [Chloroflexota bacterium]MBL1195524.1 hypothetical protein [Chloroflexota bacterium]NOH12806.1 hypothetical protein [Chloroflexota bacterium]
MRIERKHWPYWGLALLFLALISLPYVYAYQAGGDDFVFGGFLLNPIDGNSYLAKMRQGWNGSWTFTLPYTAEPGEGSYLFLFYLFLGHVARVTGMSTLLTFHAVRVLGAILLLWAVYEFCKSFFSEGRWRLLAFALSSFGSGLGWIAVFFNAFTPDLWVAETFPFLSAYATPHFAIGLTLQITLLNPAILQKLDWRKAILLGVLSLLLAIIMPFGAVVVGVMWLGVFVWQLVAREDVWNNFWRLVAVGVGSGPLSVYYLWVARNHPVLAGWNAQNLTPSPPLGELLIALSPALLLALVGAWCVWQKRDANQRLLLVWFILGFILLYAPFSLQRRFISAFYVPVAVLAVMGIVWIVEHRGRWRRRLVVGVLVLSTVTNMIVLLSAIDGIRSRSTGIYLFKEELEAYQWLEENAPSETIVLAMPLHSLRIPVYSDARVIYGHPFETVDAEEKKVLVMGFLEEEVTLEQINATLEQSQINYILVGPTGRRAYGGFQYGSYRDAIFYNGVFAIHELP